MWYDNLVNMETFVGLVFKSIDVSESDDEIFFETECGRKFRMFHSQDCCESVYIESIVGCFSDLIGTPILIAEESASCNENPDDVDMEYQASFTWTFYKFATIKGYVDIRWYGESNGYYSESVDIHEITSP